MFQYSRQESVTMHLSLSELDYFDPIKQEWLYFRLPSPSKAGLPSRSNPLWSLSASQSGAHLHGKVDFLLLFYLIWNYLETDSSPSRLKSGGKK